MPAILKTEAKPRKPTLAECHALIGDLKERNRIADAAEDLEMQRRGRVPLHQTMPLRDGRDESGRFDCFVPKRRFWKLRRKYGRELFTTESGQKDLRRHHPEYFTQTISVRPTFGFSRRAAVNIEHIFGPRKAFGKFKKVYS